MVSRMVFAPGVRLAADFDTMDLAIPQLAGFIETTARRLRHGDTISRAVRVAVHEHGAAARAFRIADDDEVLEREFALSDPWSFPAERLPAQLRLASAATELTVPVDAVLAPDLSQLLRLCGAGRHTARAIREDSGWKMAEPSPMMAEATSSSQ